MGLTLALGKDTWAFFTLWEKVLISFSQLLEVFTLFSPMKQQWKEAPALHKLPLDVALQENTLLKGSWCKPSP